MARRLSLSLILCVLMATAGSAAPAPVYREPPKPKASDVYAAMQGTWEVVHKVKPALMMRRGIALVSVPQRISIRGNTWEYLASDNGVVATLSSKNRIVLDSKASPATIDLIQLGFRDEYTALKGIVKVEGDTLTFCYVYAQEAKAERPKEFVVGNPSQAIHPKDPRMMTLKRVE